MRSSPPLGARFRGGKRFNLGGKREKGKGKPTGGRERERVSCREEKVASNGGQAQVIGRDPVK